MFTPRITQGIDFNPAQPHFEAGFIATSVNIVLPRRVCQQLGRIRHWKTSGGKKTPIFLACSEKCRTPHVKAYGLHQVRQLFAKEEYLSDALVKCNNLKVEAAERIAPKVTPVWKELYIRLAAERQCFIKYPLASIKWWLEHDGNDICSEPPEVENVIEWQTEAFVDTAQKYEYGDIRDIDADEYEAMRKRRTLGEMEKMELMKYHCLHLVFKPSPPEVAEKLYNRYVNHRGQIYNVADSSPLHQGDCYHALAQIFEKPVPPTGPRPEGRKRAWTHKRVSNAKLIATGWEPTFPSFVDAAREVAESL